MERLQELLVKEGYNIGNSGPNRNGVDGQPGRLTRDAVTAYVKKKCLMKNYIFFEDNIYSLRMNDTFTDKFSDFGFVFKGGVCVSIMPWTTKPGKYYVSNPVTVGGITGTGCMKEGQWIDSHKYEKTPKSKWGKSGYFIQNKIIQVYRDGNKDNTLDKNIVKQAPVWFGFFLHSMGRGFSIWNWSAGCNGAPLAEWQAKVDPFFADGQVINYTILEPQN